MRRLVPPKPIERIPLLSANPIERIPSCCYAQEIMMALTQCCRRAEAVSSRVALLSVTWTEQSEYGPCYCP